MKRALAYGTVQIIAGGAMQGSFAVLLKYMRRWAWENAWMIYAAVGLLLLPAIVALLTVPHLVTVVGGVGAKTLLVTILFGMGWGIANILCGLAFPKIGVALATAIVVGLSSSLGSLVPLLISNPGSLARSAGLSVVVGVCLAMSGIALLGWTSSKREMTSSTRNPSATRAGIRVGLIMCVAAGALAPMLNFSFAFGASIISVAVSHGASPQKAVNVIWLLALFGGFISNAGYCVFLMRSNQTFRRFIHPDAGRDWVFSAGMGALWTMGLFCYGWGAYSFGEMKGVVGWPIFQTVAILASTGVGIASGEWRGAPAWFVRRNCAAVALLIAAIVFIGVGNLR